MERALTLARQAAEVGEVPVGAVLVKNGLIIAEASNEKERLADATRHAEIICIQKACQNLNTWRLFDCDLYVTLEPCIMCAGAISLHRMRHVYFGATDPKGGALESLYQVGEDSRLNHRFSSSSGHLGQECSEVLTSFFRQLRRSK